MLFKRCARSVGSDVDGRRRFRVLVECVVVCMLPALRCRVVEWFVTSLYLCLCCFLLFWLLLSSPAIAVQPSMPSFKVVPCSLCGAVHDALLPCPCVLCGFRHDGDCAVVCPRCRRSHAKRLCLPQFFTVGRRRSRDGDAMFRDSILCAIVWPNSLQLMLLVQAIGCCAFTRSV